MHSIKKRCTLAKNLKLNIMEQEAINLFYSIKNQGNYPKFILYYKNKVVYEYFTLSSFATAIETKDYDKIEVKEY